MSLKAWIIELRAQFLTASVIPVILGTCYAYYLDSVFSLNIFLLALVSVIFLHSGTNIVNDYFDYKSTTDSLNNNRNPFSGGSGMLPKLNPRSVYRLGLTFFLLGSLIGLYLFSILGLIILLFGFIGVFSGYFYTSPKISLASKGLGELVIGLNFGILITMGSFFVQAGYLSITPLLLSLPITFLIIAVILINQFPDYESDKKTGKNTIVVRFGRKKSVKVYETMLLLTYLSIILLVLFSILPLISIFSLITIILAKRSISLLRVNYSRFPEILPANASTVMNHLITGLILILTILISSFI